mgnify:CR=1 FL=1
MLFEVILFKFGTLLKELVGHFPARSLKTFEIAFDPT